VESHIGSAESDSCRGNQSAVRFEESSHAIPCNYVVIYWASTGTDLCSGTDTAGQDLQPVEDQGVGVMLHPQALGEHREGFDKDIRLRLEWFAIR
jgi:hypothetical protein